MKGMTKRQQDEAARRKLPQMTHNVVSDCYSNSLPHLLTIPDSLAISVSVAMKHHVAVRSDMHAIIAGSRRRPAPTVVRHVVLCFSSEKQTHYMIYRSPWSGSAGKGSTKVASPVCTDKAEYVFIYGHQFHRTDGPH